LIYKGTNLKIILLLLVVVMMSWSSIWKGWANRKN